MPIKISGKKKPRMNRGHGLGKEMRAKNSNSPRRGKSILAIAASLKTRNKRLQAQVRKLEKERAGYRPAPVDLVSQMPHAGRGSPALARQKGAMEPLNDTLLKIFVASHRLHSTLHREQLLLTLQEIVSDLIGSQELAIFELDDERSSLSLVTSLGTDATRCREIPIGTGLIGRVALTGEPYFNDGGRPANALPEESHLTASIPLNADGKVLGVIAIFRLLEQKGFLERSDYELFDFLSAHAGLALHCVKLGVTPGTASDGLLRTVRNQAQ